MRFKRSNALAIAAALLGTLGLVVTAGPALAQPPEQCSVVNGFNGYCLNAKNGGPDIQAWQYGNYNNSAFEGVGINLCNTNPTDLTTATCPFTVGSGLNQAGNFILDFEYVHSGSPYYGDCIGDSSAGGGTMAFTGCNNPATGTGGGYGTVFVIPSVSCDSIGGPAINREWSDNDANYRYLEFANSNGATVYDNQAAGTCLAGE